MWTVHGLYLSVQVCGQYMDYIYQYRCVDSAWIIFISTGVWTVHGLYLSVQVCGQYMDYIYQYRCVDSTWIIFISTGVWTVCGLYLSVPVCGQYMDYIYQYRCVDSTWIIIIISFLLKITQKQSQFDSDNTSLCIHIYGLNDILHHSLEGILWMETAWAIVCSRKWPQSLHLSALHTSI